MTSTLAYAMNDLKSEVGYATGYGMGTYRDDQAWDTFQEHRITMYVKEGLNSFYYCGHAWSFLLPTATLTLDSGASKLTLPEDFNGFEGILTTTVDGETLYEPLNLTGEAMVRAKYSSHPSTTGRPLLAAVRTLKDVTSGQRHDLYVWPLADQAYTVQGRYHIAPDYLTAQSPHVYGGPQHSQTVLAACLAAAELHGDETMAGQQAHFQRKLAQSIEMDRRLKPANLGYNGDNSDRREFDRRKFFGYPTITVNGVEPT